jgi:hypothetical protein
MKKFLIALSLILSSQLAIAEYYDVTLTRTGDNTYLVENWSGGHEYWEIVTDYCYEDAYYDDAILSYSWDGYDNYLEFSNGYSCEFREALDIKVYD